MNAIERASVASAALRPLRLGPATRRSPSASRTQTVEELTALEARLNAAQEGQTVVDDAKRGRVMSLFQISWSGLVPIGSMIMGGLADGAGLGARRTLLITSSICVLWSLGMVLRHPPERH